MNKFNMESDFIISTSFTYTQSSIYLQDDISKNNITINGVDYFAYYIDPNYKKNKGANSFVFVLYEAQNYENYEDAEPDLVIKISNKRDYKSTSSEYNSRFYREIDALIKCKERHISHVVNIHAYGKLSCNTKNKKGNDTLVYFPFYVMDYATSDLRKYIDNNHIDYVDKIDLCLQIAMGLEGLYKLGYYHRDLKPDNILIFDNTWKIGDLGLIEYREKDSLYDKKNEFIGPKGWLSPEAMNKYLYSESADFEFDCKIDHQSDIFQLGKIFWYIIQGNAPIGCISRNDYFDQHDEVYNLLKFMLNHSKKKRPITITNVIAELRRVLKKL